MTDNDFDNDGVNDPYDGAPANAAIQTIGRGTHTDPYLIHNIYQLQAIAGVDHQGNRLCNYPTLQANLICMGIGIGLDELEEAA